MELKLDVAGVRVNVKWKDYRYKRFVAITVLHPNAVLSALQTNGNSELLVNVPQT